MPGRIQHCIYHVTVLPMRCELNGCKLTHDVLEQRFASQALHKRRGFCCSFVNRCNYRIARQASGDGTRSMKVGFVPSARPPVGFNFNRFGIGSAAEGALRGDSAPAEDETGVGVRELPGEDDGAGEVGTASSFRNSSKKRCTD